MVTCTAIAIGILRLLWGRRHFFAKDGVHLEVEKLAPLENRPPRATLMLHADLAEDVSGGLVAFEVRGENAVEIELLESITDDGAGGLGGIAMAPVGDAKPVAEFSSLVLHVGMEADAAAEAPIAAIADGEAEFVFFGDSGEKFTSVFFFVRIRNAQGGSGDLAGTDQWNQLRDVGIGERAEPEACGFEDKISHGFYNARARPMPASAAPRQSKLLEAKLVNISSHWPCSK